MSGFLTQSVPAAPSTTAPTDPSGTDLLRSAGLRVWLTSIADHLIPAGDGMPAASEVAVTADQLGRVLAVRPDLAAHLRRAFGATVTMAAADAIDLLTGSDPDALDAITLTVAGGYYMHPDVRRRLGYTGQQPRTITIAEGIDEDMLMRVVERGPIYRGA
ncbi:hypothetical protein GYA93_16860 [Gordonia desulfuricans]|uniref:Uncharacterized protein n=1 Tax=Gordonia desulfuricans TaxID=89051 RepID=A0A7K3LSK4_9ACTN|nr:MULTISPECIES: hypothetical protein [Gordonia]EMP14075.1 hypothetical protein ISGA_1348 [Gordonia sp. NB41Y]NDK91238.1 hypothetical protein [Gordonia desulfuricans]WLP88676.1 hypothetical protein Q9K23_13730 [Gordonia sp. NB41Y]